MIKAIAQSRKEECDRPYLAPLSGDKYNDGTITKVCPITVKAIPG